ncbi:hypothetical protein BRW65_27785 [Mycobacterium paraffinicum]|uniref:Uncharacterized protein n=1 Tax=Mycobacterium paraffinicum TaxID=53378 RepID=A0A1Q4HEK3_9MYCO|nr:hypothetical protein BRW65_27785 [Mycobacterium paraffinicum]
MIVSLGCVDPVAHHTIKLGFIVTTVVRITNHLVPLRFKLIVSCASAVTSCTRFFERPTQRRKHRLVPVGSVIQFAL